ncbi:MULTISPECIES: hypothetical protein [Klebsiella pneumoniae complex]|uniref:hypothetical protein n=1 Tax=Klebsiella pneumoniae complex TaxID=3390273 RepID=UPI0007CCE44F|nr:MULTISPECIES: hypothetical protein [Klebsiella]HDU5566066.1 hypothetical protein [Klebsiella pneumoniae subsp. pneumoniae]AWX76367.1 hypothetical protein DQB70_08920 [Klebsiella variicola]MBW6019808.1 hypothetical protein [Klebsiella pneumoniae]QFY21907.1 hypothetical protein C2D62_08720 [Klebsiella variicola]SAX51498.1 Uncharacterised protein [Klebsiella variicola]
MATGIVNKYAAFWGAKSAVLHVPFAGAWEGYFSFGINAETSIRNLIEGKPALSIIGNPLYGDNYIELTGGQVAYLVSGIKNSEDMTIVASVMPVNDASSAVVSNYQSQRADGSGLCIGTQLGFDVNTPEDGNVQATFNHGAVVNGVSTGARANTQDTPINAWYLISGRVKNADRTRTVNNLTTGSVGTNKPALNPADPGDVLRFGSAYNNQFGGKLRICEIAVFSEYLPDENYSSLIQFMRKSAAKKGVQV